MQVSEGVFWALEDNILLDLHNSSHHTHPHPNNLCSYPPSGGRGGGRGSVHRLFEVSFFNDVEPTVISKQQKQPKTTLDLTVSGLTKIGTYKSKIWVRVLYVGQRTIMLLALCN